MVPTLTWLVTIMAINTKPVIDVPVTDTTVTGKPGNQVALPNVSVERIRLLQLASSTMPVGAFTYSQGLEWAIENGWVGSAEQLEEWLVDLLDGNVTYLEVPVFKRLYDAFSHADLEAVAAWNRYLLASRETMELRQEEQQRGRAFSRLLAQLEPTVSEQELELVTETQLAGLALVSQRWGIGLAAALETFTWSWMENLVLAGVKLVPLGQTRGQQLILSIGSLIPAAVSKGLALDDHDIGYSCQAQAIASSMHETQYTRLFRS